MRLLLKSKKVQHTGAMIALFPDNARGLRVPGGEEPAELHVTLCYLGKATDLSEQQRLALYTTVDALSLQHAPLAGRVGGYGRFQNEDGDVLYLVPDVVGLAGLRQEIAQALTRAGLSLPSEHGWSPHLTLQYLPHNMEIDEIDKADKPISFSSISLCIGGDRTDYPLRGEIIHKSQRLLVKSRIVKNPGSRGGIGYWDGMGRWHYGVRPTYHAHPLYQEYTKHVAQHHPGGAGAPGFKEWARQHRGVDVAASKGTVAAGVGGSVLAARTANKVQKRVLNQGSPAVKAAKEHIAATYGYKVSEDAGLFAAPMEQRETTWRNVSDAISFAHESIPGLSDLVKRKKLHLVVNNTPVKGPDISGRYSTNPLTGARTLTIRQDMGQTFFHEIGHFIDNCLEGGQDEKVLGRGLPFASQRQGSAASKVIKIAQRSPAFRAFVDEGMRRNGEMYGSYLREEPEVFARCVNVYLDHLYTQKFGRQTPGDTIFESFSAQEKAAIARQMKALLRTATYKSLRSYLDDLSKARTVQRPGSRGGIGYWDGSGTWHYGQRPTGQRAEEGSPAQPSTIGEKKKASTVQKIKKTAGLAVGAAMGLTYAKATVAWYKTEHPPQAVKDIQKHLHDRYNYTCTDTANAFSTNASRTDAWRTMADQIAFFHQMMPAWDSYVRREGAQLEATSALLGYLGPDLGQYNPQTPAGKQSIQSTRHRPDVLFHELCHGADAITELRQDYGSNVEGTPLHGLVEKLKQEEEHRRSETAAEGRDSKYREYLGENVEVLARFGSAYFMRLWDGQRPQTSNSLAEYASRDKATRSGQDSTNGYEQWSPAVLDKYGPQLIKLLNQSVGERLMYQSGDLDKSQRQPVKNPGSRGGKGYRTSSGTWRYGEQKADLLTDGAEALAAHPRAHKLYRPEHLATLMGLTERGSVKRFHKLPAKAQSHLNAAAAHLRAHRREAALAAGLLTFTGKAAPHIHDLYKDARQHAQGLDDRAERGFRFRDHDKHIAKTQGTVKREATEAGRVLKDLAKRGLPHLIETAAQHTGRPPLAVYDSVSKHLLSAYAHAMGITPQEAVQQLGPDVGGILPPRRRYLRSIEGGLPNNMTVYEDQSARARIKAGLKGEMVEKSKAHKPVQRPGSRGGHGYYNDQGEWVYGERPIDHAANPDSHLTMRRYAAHLAQRGLLDNLHGLTLRQALQSYYRAAYQRDPFMWALDLMTRTAVQVLEARRYGVETTDEGCTTSPELRAIPARIAARYGYRCIDATGWFTEPIFFNSGEGRGTDLTLPTRMAQWDRVEQALEQMHTALPGLEALVRAKRLRLEVRDVNLLQNGNLDDAHAAYIPVRDKDGKLLAFDGSDATIQVASKHPKSLWHELGHFIDNALAPDQSAERVQEGYIPPFASEQQGAYNTLIDALYDASAHAQLLRDDQALAAKHGAPDWMWQQNQAYLRRRHEMFARFVRAWVEYKATGHYEPPENNYEKWSPQELNTLGALLESVFRDQGLLKSQRVQHPGSRGGKGYWDKGQWYYGTPPPELAERLRSAATAIKRKGPSAPLKAFEEAGLLHGRILDYGSGHGADVAYLKEQGKEVQGWDPNHDPHTDLASHRGQCDRVLNIYVLNVIKDPLERLHVAQGLYSMTRPGGYALVAVRDQKDVAKIAGSPEGDGVRTQKGTFQHGFTFEELRALLLEAGFWNPQRVYSNGGLCMRAYKPTEDDVRHEQQRLDDERASGHTGDVRSNSTSEDTSPQRRLPDMRGKKEVTIRYTDNGDSVVVKGYLLGTGNHARAYLVGDKVLLIVKDGDFAKDMIADIDNPHVPHVERLGDTRDATVYQMPYYPKINAKANPEAWRQYRTLQRLYGEAAYDVKEAHGHSSYGKREGFAASLGLIANHGYEINERWLDMVDADDSLPQSLKDGVHAMCSNASNYGAGVGFEWGPRNIAVDDEGRLVLRDVLFDAEAHLREILRPTRQRGFAW